VTALRNATKGRRAPDSSADDPDDVTVIPLDTMLTGPHDQRPDRDPEQAFERTQQQLVLLRLARQLPDRERAVFFGIHFDGRTRAELAPEIGVTPQAIGQMYVRILKALHAKACVDPEFPTTTTAGREER
jgi:RNA polymerase sigma factor (sigma-70 family)